MNHHGERAGLEGVLGSADLHYSTFKNNFAAKVSGRLELNPGKAMLRLRCPKSGALYVNNQLVFELPSEEKVRQPALVKICNSMLWPPGYAQIGILKMQNQKRYLEIGKNVQS